MAAFKDAGHFWWQRCSECEMAWYVGDKPGDEDAEETCERCSASALTPPTPEDVARDYKEAMEAEGWSPALARLHDWAARAMVLKADCCTLSGAVQTERKRALSAESERDAARRDAAEAQEAIAALRARTEPAPCSRLAPTPTPDVPPLSPVPGLAMPPATVQEAIQQHAQPAPSGVCGATLEIPSGEPVTPCDLPAGHNEREDWLAGKAVLHEGWCMGSRMVWSAEEPAQSEPAAPEVVLDTDGVRVVKHLDAEDFTVSYSHAMGAVGALGVLSRALAEAKRELRCEHGRDKDYCAKEYEDAQECAARKAAESMRERAAKAVQSAPASFNRNDHSDRIRNLPLE